MSSSALYTPPPYPPPPSPPPVIDAPSARPQTALRTFRDAIREISPVWLRGKVAGGILYAIGAVTDALADSLVGGVKTRFPGLYGDESLGLLGRERRIRRGRTETPAVYASRLMRWLEDHRRRGGPYAMLAQLFAHYAPNNFRIDLVYRNGKRFSMAADGTITRDTVGDYSPAEWAHWTLYYFWPFPVHTDGVWSDSGTWDDGGVWDSDLSVQDVTDLRLIPHEWNAAHCFGHVVLLTDDIELWDYPIGPWSDPGVWLDHTVHAVQFSIA